MIDHMISDAGIQKLCQTSAREVHHIREPPNCPKILKPELSPSTSSSGKTEKEGEAHGGGTGR